MGFWRRKDTALVTGASGFIGAAVARRLLRDGFNVRVLLRHQSSRDNISAAYETVVGDITDPETVRRAMSGVRYLFHLAADYRLWAPDPAQLLRSNVEGTEVVMRAALAAGVERVIHTSSVATLAPGKDGVCTEASRLEPEHAIGPYKRSKILSERVVESLVEREGLPAVIVCPSAPLGPGDVRPTPTGRIISEALLGRMPAYVETGLNIVHVDDVAAGQLAALHRGETGERYILGGENMTLCALLNEIAAMTGGRGPLVRLPWRALMPLAALNEMRAHITGAEPFLNCDSLRLSATRMFFDDSKARQALGYASRPAHEAIGAAVRWFQQKQEDATIVSQIRAGVHDRG